MQEGKGGYQTPKNEVDPLELPVDSSEFSDLDVPMAKPMENSTQAECVGCGSRFVVSFEVSTTKCPVCGSRVDL